MKRITLVRLWYGLSAFFIVGLIANLVVLLRRPVFNWRDAVSLPLFFFTFLSLNALVKAHSKCRASPEAVIEMGAARYLLAGLAVGVAVSSFLIGFVWHR
jgi:hypothetical protein